MTVRTVNLSDPSPTVRIQLSPSLETLVKVCELLGLNADKTCSIHLGTDGSNAEIANPAFDLAEDAN